MKNLINKVSAEIFDKIEEIANDSQNELGDMIEIEIGNKMFEVDYSCAFIDTTPSIRGGWESETYEIEFNEIEVRNIWDNDKDFQNVIKAINNQLNKMI